jgi:hypothetical protein
MNTCFGLKQEIKILVKTKQSGNSLQIFPNWRLAE